MDVLEELRFQAEGYKKADMRGQGTGKLYGKE